MKTSYLVRFISLSFCSIDLPSIPCESNKTTGFLDLRVRFGRPIDCYQNRSSFRGRLNRCPKGNASESEAFRTRHEVPMCKSILYNLGAHMVHIMSNACNACNKCRLCIAVCRSKSLYILRQKRLMSARILLRWTL